MVQSGESKHGTAIFSCSIALRIRFDKTCGVPVHNTLGTALCDLPPRAADVSILRHATRRDGRRTPLEIDAPSASAYPKATMSLAAAAVTLRGKE